MDLKNKQLDVWFLEETFNNERFPYHNKDNYQEKFKTISNQLKSKVLPYVNTGAMINNEGLLTDHGPDHIIMLIDRITAFLDNNDQINLSPYESYILLMSAYIHDSGNIYGRDNHQNNAREVIEDIKKMNIDFLDRFELDAICEIASAHCGDISSDPIGQLDKEMIIADIPQKNEKYVRSQLLAAILRLADELSENRSRASRYNLIKDIALPPKSKIFHIYADSLNYIDIDLRDHTIKMQYRILEQYLEPIPKMNYKKDENGKKLIVDNKPVEEYINTFLLHEIYLRTLKTHYERIYCGRYFKTSIYFNSIEVEIYIIRVNKTIKKYQYSLVDGNNINDLLSLEDFYRICPQMKTFTGEVILNEIKKI